MAISKFIIASLFISLLAVQLVQADKLVNTDGSKPTDDPKMDCGVACSGRCQLSSRPNLCNRACGTCCARCNCVPPGTSGNHELCSCYKEMTTHGGKRKCP